MALSGTFISNTGVNLNVEVRWSATQNIPNNYSDVTMNVYIYTWTLSVSAKTTTLNATGCAAQSFTAPAISDTSESMTYWYIGSKTFRVYHNDNGTMNATLSAYYPYLGTYGGKSFAGTGITAAKTVTLNTIPRATNISSVSGQTMGSPMTINATPAVSTFTHTLKYNCQGVTGTIATGLTGATISQVWDIPLSLASVVPNGYLTSVDLIMETYSGATLIGTSTYPKLIYVPESVVPTIGALTASVSSDAISQAWETFIKGKSKATLSWTDAAGAYGSTLVSWKIEATGYPTYTGTSSASSGSKETDLINHTGALTFTITVTDSRGRVGTKTVSITAYDYATPSISSFTAQRGTGGAADDDGTQILTNQVYGMSSCNGHNALSVQKINIMQLPAGAYGSDIVVESGTQKTNTGPYSADNAFRVRLTLTDAYTTITATAEVGTSFSLIDYYYPTGKGIAFGKKAELDETFECDLNAKFNKVVSGLGLLDFFYPVGTIYYTVSTALNTAEKMATHFGGTWVAWGTGRTPVGIDTGQTEFDTLEETGGAKTHTLQLTEIPSHYHDTTVLGYSGSAPATGSASTTYNTVAAQDDLAQVGMDTGYAGGGQAHNNLQPYITCYMWKRTA